MSTGANRTAERDYGVAPLETLEQMSGLEFLGAIVEGRLPAPPITRTLDFQLTAVAEGRAVFQGRPGFAHYNPFGSVHGGWAATLLDSCMSRAVQATLPKGFGYTTLEFKISLARAITEKTGPVEAEGTVVRAGQRVGLAEGRLVDGDGRLLATGSATCLIFAL